MWLINLNVEVEFIIKERKKRLYELWSYRNNLASDSFAM